MGKCRFSSVKTVKLLSRAVAYFNGQDRLLKWSKYGGHAVSILKSKIQNEPLISCFQVVKMTTWSAASNVSKWPFAPLWSSVRFWALDFIGRFPPDDRLGNQWVKMTHWFWGGSLRPSPHYFWNQVSNLITWFLSALVSVFLGGGFLLFLLQQLRELNQHYGSLNRCASVIYVLAHRKLLAEGFDLFAKCKDLIAYRLHLRWILHPTDLIPKCSAFLA